MMACMHWAGGSIAHTHSDEDADIQQALALSLKDNPGDPSTSHLALCTGILTAGNGVAACYFKIIETAS